MTKDSGGDTVEQGGSAKPRQDGRDREFEGIAGNVAVKDEKPSPGGAIDLDTAHDRAS